MTLQEIKDKFKASVGFKIKRTSDQIVFKVNRFSETHYIFDDSTSLPFTESGFEEALDVEIKTNFEVQEEITEFCNFLIKTFRMQNKIEFDSAAWPESYRGEILVQLSTPIQYLSLGMLKQCRDWFVPFVANETWMDQARKDGFMTLMNDEITRLAL